ncbi:AMP-binding protein [Saccharospirillum salsuginis]|uniref:AMP-dependent synthetase n=1 Tax=Saccharospirillum salsuginis TaxID=418750 RepID=A0A918KSI7_9GAMM|nr:AMP-binding protein [Saccharospirillum salsuginis]GGX74097.1 AMP-dependent synthetase [Saccharospirillum salsuginis]
MAYKTPLEQLSRHVKERGDQAFLHQPVNRELKIWTWKQAEEDARKVAQGLRDLGLEPGDRVAIFAKNSAEWFISDLAIMMAGMVSVPIYATAGEDIIRHVVEHSGAKAVFVGKLDDTKAGTKVLDGSIPRIGYPYETVPHDHRWADWVAEKKPIDPIADVGLDDVMTLVYTSGSTGKPKGVVLNFSHFAAAATANQHLIKLDPDKDRMVSYLPLAHITERGVIEGTVIYSGSPVYFVESLATFVDDLKVAQPTAFLSVPRLWTRFQAGIHEKMPEAKLQKLLKIPLLGKIVAKKIRQGLGLNSVHTFGSGSAPISPSILQWYYQLGMPICEAWGMTETTGLSTCNIPFRKERLGTIGVPIDCLEARVSETGELQVRGDTVFSEYYNNPEATAESFVDGWFKTGDKATQNPDGSFTIVGRLKEEFKTTKGKYVTPVPIESRLAANPEIEQVCVMGAGRTQPVAVVVVAEHLRGGDRSALRASLQQTLDEVNASLEAHQKLDGILVTEDSWDIDNDMLTPTLKLRRSHIEDQYVPKLDLVKPGSVLWIDEA